MNNLNITLTTITFLSAILLLLSYTNQWSPSNPDADDLRTAQIVQACESVGYWDTGTVRIYCSVKE
jgi:hypothetical protein